MCLNILEKKQGDKSQKCIFIDHNDATKGYGLFDLVTRKVIVRSDVTFDK